MSEWVRTLIDLDVAGDPAVMVTVVQCAGSTPREPGARMFVRPDGSILGTIGGGQLESRAASDAREVFGDAQPRSIVYPLCSRTGQCCGGRVELFFEPLNCGPRLFLFGAGHVGQAVARTLEGTPFRVTLVDSREEWIDSPRIPKGVRREKDWKRVVEAAAWSARDCYAVVMTHSHDLDLEIVRALLEVETRYVGLIGSQTKWKRFQDKLKFLGVEEWEWEKVNCPIGLPIGGKSPQEVAISLSAQLLKDHHSRIGTSAARRGTMTAEPVPDLPDLPEPLDSGESVTLSSSPAAAPS